MMKKRLLSGLLIFFSAILLSACNSGKTEQNDDVDNTPEDRTVIETEEQKTDSFSEIIQDTIEVDYKWYKGRFYRNSENTNLWINLSDTNNELCVRMPGYSFNVNQPEILESDDYGTTLRYTYYEEYGRFDFVIDYMTESDEIIVLYTNYTYQSNNAVDFSGIYMYDKDLSASMESVINEEVTTSNLGFTDGQRFECFETVSGENVILTVHLFYSDDSNEPSAYKGELSNGIEFWFEFYDSYTDEMQYKIECMDGSNAFLTYFPSRGEIVWTAEEGTDYGNMYAYSGTYICLPDEIEE